MKIIMTSLLTLVLSGPVSSVTAQTPGFGYPGYQRPAPSWTGARQQVRIRMERDRSEEGYLLRIFTSGDIDPQAVQVSVQGNSLLIEHDQSLRQEEKGDRGYYSFSRSSSRFRRRLSLPRGADAENMRRSVEGGVITITLPLVRYSR